jgi:ubiquinone/menaquinone biosynthesis C-methylase UbiE
MLYLPDQEAATPFVRRRTHPLSLLFLLERSHLEVALQGQVPSSHHGTRTSQHILDLACGPGVWVLDLAMHGTPLPEVEAADVVGLDPTHHLVEFARTEAQVRGVSSARFLELDAMATSLPFPTAAFDLVHGSCLSEVVIPDRWPLLLREILRVLRPEGRVQLLEFEPMISCAPAIATYNTLIRDLRHGTDNREQLVRSMEDAGFKVEQQIDRLDCSFGTDLCEQVAYLHLLQLDLLTPDLLSSGVADTEQIAALARQMAVQLCLPQFKAHLPLVQLLGRKPAECRGQGESGGAHAA